MWCAFVCLLGQREESQSRVRLPDVASARAASIAPDASSPSMTLALDGRSPVFGQGGMAEAHGGVPGHYPLGLSTGKNKCIYCMQL